MLPREGALLRGVYAYQFCNLPTHGKCACPVYRRWWVYGGISYQVKQGADDRGVAVENIDKSQHTDFNEDTTNESASVACSNVRLWKLNTQKEWRNTSWRLGDERADKDSADFVDSKENKWVGS